MFPQDSGHHGPGAPRRVTYASSAGRGFCSAMLLCLSFTSTASSFDCLIEPAQTIELASPVSGLLAQVLATRGDRISKGQLLVRLESSAEQAAADLARYRAAQSGPTQLAQAKLEFSRKKFERRRDMAAERLMSVQERDDAEAEYRLADAELAVAKENRELAAIEHRQQNSLLELRTLRSPFDGVVADQLAYPGEVVEASGNKKAILKLAQLDPLRVRVILPKEFFGKLAAGMSVEIRSEIENSTRHVARVKSIDRLVDAASGTFVALLELPNPKLLVPAGTKCEARFSALDANPRKAVPASRK